MITFGNIYLITKDFEAAVNFYRELFERDVVRQNKSRYAVFLIDGLGLAILYGKYDELHPDEVIKQEKYCSLYDDMGRIRNNTGFWESVSSCPCFWCLPLQ